MPQTYFSTTLSPGETSRPFTLPAANPDNTGSRVFVLSVDRDRGLLLADGEHDMNLSAIVSVRQLQTAAQADGTTLVVLASAPPIGGCVMFQPDPTQGVLTLYNEGPGKVNCVSIEDGIQ